MDKFRIEIWEGAGEASVYGNSMDADDDADSTNVVSHGGIKIQKG